MDGSAELAQLAELLRMGAKTGRQIAAIRPHDAAAIERLAVQAEAMAVELDALVVDAQGASPAATRRAH